MNKFNRVAMVSTIVLVGLLMVVGLVSAATGAKAANDNSINAPPSVDSNVYTQPLNDWQGLKLFAERSLSFQDFMGQQIMIDAIVVEEENLVIYWSVR